MAFDIICTLLMFPCELSLTGAANSGDIDILLTHPEFTSTSKKKVSVVVFRHLNSLCTIFHNLHISLWLRSIFLYGYVAYFSMAV